MSQPGRQSKTFSHFSREPRIVSHFSRGPRSSRHPGQRNGAPIRQPADAPAITTTMAGQESSSGRRFGEILVDENIITPTQLDIALQLQAVSPSYVPIGQVLLANKLVTRRQLTTLLDRHHKRSRLGDILVKAGQITEAQLQEALDYQRRAPLPIGQLLVGLGYVSGTAMRNAVCTQLHVNFFDLDPIVIDRTLTRVIAERFAVRHLLVPLFRVDDVLVVAMDDPSQAELIEELQVRLKLHVETVMTTLQKLRSAMARLYGPAVPARPDAAGVPNILIGPIRDHFVVELAAKALRGVVVTPA